MKRSATVLCLFLIVSIMILPWGTIAQADWMHDFQQPLPDTVVVEPDPASDSFQYNLDGGILTLHDDTPHGDGGAFSAWIYDDIERFYNVHVTATINPSGDSTGILGVYARSGGGSSYLLGLMNTPNHIAGGRLLFVKQVGDESVVTMFSRQDSIEDYSAAYRIGLSITGQQPTVIAGSLFDLDGTELATVEFTDTGEAAGPILDSGVSGVWASVSMLAPETSLHATFDDVASVPEPSALGMVLLAGACLAIMRRRRSSS